MFTEDEKQLIHELLVNHRLANKRLMAYIIINGKGKRYCMEEGDILGATILARCEKENKQCLKLIYVLANMSPACA